MEARRRLRYSRLRQNESDDEDERDLRFEYTPSSLDRVPWKSVALAFFLVSLGSLLLLLSYFIFSGHMPGDASQAYGLLTLGVLAFLPAVKKKRRQARRRIFHNMMAASSLLGVFMRQELHIIHGEVPKAIDFHPSQATNLTISQESG